MKNLSKLLLVTPLFLLATAVEGHAVAVDLSGWTATAGGTWNVQPGNDSVLQTVNGRPTYFYESGANAQGTALSGKIEVVTTGDDDFIGFALGFEGIDDFNSASADYMLVDWKQNNQGAAARGLAISRVSDSTTDNDFWAHVGGVTEIARGTTLGDTGWADNTEYSFDLVFTSSLIQVSVDGSLELSITAADAGLPAFDNGAFAFYNYSQSQVLYSAIEDRPAPVPEGGSTLAMLGLTLVGIVRFRRKAA